VRATPELFERLKHDTPFWGRHCAKIVNKKRQLVALEANGPQLRFDAALEAQRAAGKPMRAIVLKARQLGFSTWGVGKVMQRITQREFRRALIVAQENDTASQLFDMADRIWINLPPDLELGLKPYRTHLARGEFMKFGEPSRIRRNAGLVGLDSSIEISTAREVEGGRGYTFSELLATEVAFYQDQAKLTAILNAVPDEPETLVVLESTANSLNFFHDRWEAAVAGDSEYVPVFAGWTEDPDYRLEFYDDEARAEFVASIGTGPWGEDEPDLVETYGCTPEQLLWRRKTIVDKCEGKLEKFKQEYPVSPEEAFMLSGKQVFSTVLASRMRRQVEQTDPKTVSPDNPGPQLGTLEPADVTQRKIRTKVIDVPRAAVWTPKAGALVNPWRLWELPDPGDPDAGRARGAYIVAADPSGGEENEKGDTAFHAIQVVDHRTKAQVAEYRSRIDPDEVAEQILLAALLYNKALIVVETTGGYGGFMARTIRRDYGYPLVYRRRPLSKDRDRQEEKLGWDTGPGTKPFLVGHAHQLLRDGYGDEAPEVCDFVRSRLLAREFSTYVKDERGKMEPQGNAFADLLMAWMIGQYVAHERPVPAGEKQSRTSSTGRRIKDPVTGW
jgi:hypothetical protein